RTISPVPRAVLSVLAHLECPVVEPSLQRRALVRGAVQLVVLEELATPQRPVREPILHEAVPVSVHETSHCKNAVRVPFLHRGPRACRVRAVLEPFHVVEAELKPLVLEALLHRRAVEPVVALRAAVRKATQRAVLVPLLERRPRARGGRPAFAAFKVEL